MDYHLTWYKCCPYWDDVHISKNIYVTDQTTCIFYFANFLIVFSHTWPVVVYNFGQAQRTSQVERKTKCSTKTSFGLPYKQWYQTLQTGEQEQLYTVACFQSLV